MKSCGSWLLVFELLTAKLPLRTKKLALKYITVRFMLCICEYCRIVRHCRYVYNAMCVYIYHTSSAGACVCVHVYICDIRMSGPQNILTVAIDNLFQVI